MIIAQYILLGVLFLTALFIVFSVTVSKTSDEGLSKTIAGGSDTYYSREKGSRAGVALRKWTFIACVVFAVAVVVVYVIQPDYAQSYNNLDYWQQVSKYSSIFK